jgi:hypothetical protein
MTDPSDAEMLAAVERWARVTGRWDNRTMPSDSSAVSRDRPWALAVGQGSTIHVSAWAGSTGPGWDLTPYRWRVDPTTAAVWALLVDARETVTSPEFVFESDAQAWAASHVYGGHFKIRAQARSIADKRGGYFDHPVFVARVTRPLVVDVGPCPACEGDGVQHYASTDTGAPWPDKSEWLTRGGPQWCPHRSCPSCPPRARNSLAAAKRGVRAGTGRDIREAASLLLDAKLPELPDLTEMFDSRGQYLPRRERQQARQHLAVLADRLQADGDDLGPLLAAWVREIDVGRLAGWRLGLLTAIGRAKEL